MTNHIYLTFMYLVVLFIHVFDEKITKFEPLDIKGIFVGYNETSKSYHIYISTQWKIVVSRDANFDDDVVPKFLGFSYGDCGR